MLEYQRFLERKIVATVEQSHHVLLAVLAERTDADFRAWQRAQEGERL